MSQRASFMDDDQSPNSAETDLDLSDFGVKPSADPTTVAAGKAVAAHVAETHQFASRQASKTLTGPAAAVSSGSAPVRFTTGRNQQLNMKAKADTIEKLRRFAAEASTREERSVPQAEILELALQAYERERNNAG